MRAILRTLLAIVLLLVVGFVVIGYWRGASGRNTITAPAVAAGTTGTAASETASERGARLGEKAAVIASEVENAMSESAISAKIKAKMALDDSVRARSVDVSTTGATVTLTGTVRSATEHDRTIALARETTGVILVVDHLALLP